MGGLEAWPSRRLSPCPKHLARYVDEFTFRLNDGNVARHTVQRLASLLRSTNGRPITYRELTA
jgi:hypothetical protein